MVRGFNFGVAMLCFATLILTYSNNLFLTLANALFMILNFWAAFND